MPRLPFVLLVGFLLGLACRDQDGGHSCFPGNEDCPCVGGGCLPGLDCVDDICVAAVALTDPADTDASTDTDTVDTEDADDDTTAAVDVVDQPGA